MAILYMFVCDENIQNWKEFQKMFRKHLRSVNTMPLLFQRCAQYPCPCSFSFSGVYTMILCTENPKDSCTSINTVNEFFLLNYLWACLFKILIKIKCHYFAVVLLPNNNFAQSYWFQANRKYLENW